MRVVDPVLQDLRESLLRMGSLSEAILEKALTAVWKRDRVAAREVKIDDLEIDRLDLAVDEAVLRILATQAPVADDLRGVIAAKMIATDLERVGDLARNIAKGALRLADHPEVPIPPRLRSLGDEVQRVLHRALDSFADGDPDNAAVVLEQDDQVDADQDVVIRAAIEEITGRPDLVSQGVDFILIAKNLERVADHATNIAEDVILATEARNVKHAAKLEA
jgi:phosphate transport system protein